MAKFKVGDMVRIRPYDDLIREGRVERSGMVRGIGEFLYTQVEGKVSRVNKVIGDTECFVRLDGDSAQMNWPEYALELVEAAGDPAPARPTPLVVDILGAKYTIRRVPEGNDPILADSAGYSDWTAKKIVVKSDMGGTLEHLEKYEKKVMRHEIVHAFLFESGLAECAAEDACGAHNEQLVDWIAWQGPKIMDAWKEAGCL